jgi:hypothetical protein
LATIGRAVFSLDAARVRSDSTMPAVPTLRTQLPQAG